MTAAGSDVQKSDVREERTAGGIDREVIRRLPEKPGIYIFKNSEGEVLYVGKGVKLRSRVRSYFGKTTGRGPWIEKMVREVTAIEHVVTSNEVEALILESNYIKKYKPKHNVKSAKKHKKHAHELCYGL